ncbi:IclR family transcriptional regulator [Pseudooceanicola lipolyticus]|uniref:IclR family transcriptional regulator n=1 Tax=Pseudooceanicola lipolyticus TaxID=2029104 RepID=A0A2M8J4I2_9RHOB|nr:helix-turn-helix domain-containing protein [Pseudooceanicola lipolyticus]PJE37684.1 IclR family transcriptional regulator [Pseudooceanicola lipolyticus]
MTSSGKSSNAARAARILAALGEAGAKGLSLTGLAETLGDTRAPVHRALAALVEHGFVLQSGRRGNYHIGPAIHAIAMKSVAVGELTRALRPLLIDIAAETGLPTFLMARAGFDSVCLDWQSGFSTVPAMFDGIGGRLPLGVGVGGLVVLGEMDAEGREQVLRLNAPRFADWGLKEADIRAELALYAAQGWLLVSRRSGAVDICSLAKPVRGGHGVELAVSVLAPGRDMEEGLKARVIDSLSRHLSRREV